MRREYCSRAVILMGKAGRGGRGGRRGCLISITLVGLLLLLARSESSESGKVLATGNVNRGQDGDGDDGGEETTTTTVSPADGLARSWLNATRTVEEEDPFKDLVSKIPKSGKRSKSNFSFTYLCIYLYAFVGLFCGLAFASIIFLKRENIMSGICLRKFGDSFRNLSKVWETNEVYQIYLLQTSHFP